MRVPQRVASADGCAAVLRSRARADAIAQQLVHRGGFTPPPSVHTVLNAVCALRHARERPWRGRRVVLVAGVHATGLPFAAASCDFLGHLARALTRQWGAEVRLQSGTADEDLVELADASWLLHGGGGYSRLAKMLVQQRGRVAWEIGAAARESAAIRACHPDSDPT